MVISLARRMGLMLLRLMMVLLLASQGMVAEAHTPGPMTLEYDTNTDTLTVTVVHVTADVNSHYIYEIVVEKNSVQVDIQTYTSQSDPSQVVETFSVTAVDGNVLRVTAKCSVSGTISNQIIVGDSTTPTTTNTLDYVIISLIIGIAIVALGIALVSVMVIKRR